MTEAGRMKSEETLALLGELFRLSDEAAQELAAFAEKQRQSGNVEAAFSYNASSHACGHLAAKIGRRLQELTPANDRSAWPGKPSPGRL